MSQTLWLLLAGGLGVLARYSVGKVMAPGPLPTFLINGVGCFAIGLVYAVSPALPSILRTTLMVGFLGGFTTFSAFGLEVVLLWESGRRWAALAYAVTSPLFGILSTAGAITFARLISR